MLQELRVSEMRYQGGAGSPGWGGAESGGPLVASAPVSASDGARAEYAGSIPVIGSASTSGDADEGRLV
jgi:hypothetical protein